MLTPTQRREFDRLRSQLSPYLSQLNLPAIATPMAYRFGQMYDNAQRWARNIYYPTMAAKTAYNFGSTLYKKYDDWKNPYKYHFEPRYNRKNYLPYGNYIKSKQYKKYNGNTKSKRKAFSPKKSKRYQRKEY